MKILIVDDSLIMRRLLANALKKGGYKNVVEAEDGDIALKKLEEEKIDFIITDWAMPKINGLHFINLVRKLDGYENVPILMVTANAMKNDFLKATQSDIAGYIIKPIKPAELRDKIQQILKSPREQS